MRTLLVVFCVVFALPQGVAQRMTQTIRGEVSDAANGIALEGASVHVLKHGESVGLATSAADGAFSIDVPTGRYRLRVTYTGYHATEHELLVIAAKESTLNIRMQPAAEVLEAVEVNDALIAPELPGMRSLTIEKTLRVPANFFDPVRVATAWPGVVATNDQNNTIIVRGNSPNGLLWRLNGLDIVNPNHQANAGTITDKPSANGGGVNMLSAQMLERADFYLGALPAQYGNVLSGVVDMKLRAGNAREFEYTAQASLIGIDLAAEGPLGAGGRTSFLANYRYSTVGLLSLAGIDFGDEAIYFQDLSMNLTHETDGGGEFSLFGFWGNGANTFEAKRNDEWAEDKDRYDIDYASATYAVGANYEATLGGGKLVVGAAWSAGDHERTAVASPQESGLAWYVVNDNFSRTNGLFSSKILYRHALGEKASWTAGAVANYLDNSVASDKAFGCYTCSFRMSRNFGGTSSGWLYQPFANLGLQWTPRFSMDAGFRYVYFSFNGTASVEPRLLARVATSERSTLEFSYNLTSQVQSPQLYAAVGNGGLELTKAHRTDVSYARFFGKGFEARAGLFYQHLFDVPIASSGSGNLGAFSALNLLEEQPPGMLVSDGRGENYGVDVTLEKSFFGNHYFMISGSYYESKYVAADHIERDSRFNGNFTTTAVYGKEWVNSEKNRTIGLNLRTLVLGGLPALRVDVPASSDASETIYTADGFSNRMDDYFRTDIRLSFRKDKPGYTRTLAIDIQNVTNRENEAYAYFDFYLNQVVTKRQLGIIPVLVYRIDF